ncbi:EH signature domain-containing protein [[Limnothrix rosea] IAM M-220]|uniref:EH signature domain-containing protein n=1 Tax=[Limnothrix rosea] IAM M-220 TaxID=454133 RepID=UPI00095F0453|nr:EH signature domain-containing protein [[Limnothrix rosea] IAM M-220]OKH11160.1 hypothetical protein NIES208_17725 [[Limnothrix rosea] IAM M-220]
MNTTDFYPHKLWAIANACERSAPKLAIKEIRDKIQQDQTQQINRIEWLWLIAHDKDWQLQRKSEEHLSEIEIQELAIDVWAIAFNLYNQASGNDDYWLLKELSHRLLSQQGQKLAKPLLESWHKLSSDRCLNESKLIFKILRIIYDSSTEDAELKLLKLTYQHQLLPSQFWAKTDPIFPRLDCLKKYFYQLPNLFTKIDKEISGSTQFFIKVLKDINNVVGDDEQAQVVDLCLIQWQVEFFDDKPRLLQWFIQEYHKTSKGSLLSSAAIAKLNQLVGVISYQVFDSIIKSVTTKIRLEWYEKNQLEARKEFWKNYTDSFIDIRVLLPYQSSILFTNSITSKVSILEEDSNEESEVCIFELKNGMLIAEIFRGEGSDLRIFDKQYKNFLFNEPSLSIQKIRALGGKRHDHKFLWQYYCEKLLRTQYQIFPNEKILLFHGLPDDYALYSRHTGLPVPAPKKIQQRKKKLSNWIRTIDDLERQARLKYPNL